VSEIGLHRSFSAQSMRATFNIRALDDGASLNHPATTWAMIDRQAAGMNRFHLAVGAEPRFCAAVRLGASIYHIMAIK
jgi:hypothetical protein